MSRDVQRLFERYRRSGDPSAREALVRCHTPLARHLAARYARGAEPLDDLFQVACLGLLKAIDRYDPDRGTAFSTFAVPTILGELKRHFRDTTWVVRVPHSVHDLAMRVRSATTDLTQRLGREPSAAEIADVVGAGEERLAAAQAALAAYEVVSLEAPQAPDRAIGREDDELARVDERAELDELIGRLEVSQQQVLRLRFEEDLTQQQIGDRLGFSQMWVSRTLRRALRDLRSISERRLPAA